MCNLVYDYLLMTLTSFMLGGDKGNWNAGLGQKQEDVHYLTRF